MAVEPIEVQQALGYLLWVSPSHVRAHKGLEGYMSICYQELEQHFGRAGFKALNKRIGLFTVSPNWWSKQGMTRGYKVHADLDKAVREYMASAKRRLRNKGRGLVGLDGKQVITIPQGVASKDMRGITAKAWNRAVVKNLVPIDVPRLLQYIKKLQRMVDEPQSDLFIGGEVQDYQYRLDVASRLLELAREHEGGYRVIQRYIESDSGRLYGKNINLASVPRSIKEVALHGLWEYDIANCHYSILYQLAAQHGLDCIAVADYLANKRKVRKQIEADIGITEAQAKTCLIALIYGARFSHRVEDAIPAAIGKQAALRLYKHPLFMALKEEVAKAMRWIIRRWPVSRKRLQNAYGKWIEESASKPQIMAHLLQGIEAKMLEAVRKLYPSEILLLQHDGFASSERLDTAKIVQAIYEATDYKMQLEESRIALAADFGISE